MRLPQLKKKISGIACVVWVAAVQHVVVVGGIIPGGILLPQRKQLIRRGDGGMDLCRA